MSEHRCPYCGRLISQQANICPYCREGIPEPPRVGHSYRSMAGKAMARRGVFYMLLAGVLYYLAAGHSPFEFPVEISPLLTEWVLPLLFLGALGLSLYGVYLHFAR